MQVYIDESIRSDGAVFVLAALVLYDNKSKKTISRIVSQTILELKNHLRENKLANFKKLPQGRILELKGCSPRNKEYIPGLNDYRDLRDKFFLELVNQANFSLHILYIDVNEFNQPLKKSEYKKYGFFLQNLISTIRIIPNNTKLLSVIIDSQNAAKLVQEGIKLYKWRKRRKAQKNQRTNDKKKHKSWSQRIDDLLRLTYKGKKINRKIWFVPSHRDRCLQAIDVITNFSYRYSKLKLNLPPYNVSTCTQKQKKWFNSFEIIKSRTWWIHNPTLKKPKNL